MRRLIATTWYKLCAMFGGARMLPLVYLLLAACFAAVAVITSARTPESVSIALTDECGGEYSKRLADALNRAEGIELHACQTREEAEDMLLAGRAEAAITIDARYDELLASGSAVPLIELRSAPGAVSAELLRETAAGILVAERSAVVTANELEAEGFDASQMQKYIEEFESPSLYEVTVVGGAARSEAVFGSAYAGYEGTAAFALLLLLLTLSRRLSDGSSRLVAHRMGAAERGPQLAFIGDLTALFAAALPAGAIAFALAPDKSFALAIGLVCYAFCIAGLCLLLSRFGASGRIDVAAPAVAFITSLLGGCFADLASLSPALTVLAHCTPQGQLIACARGALPFAALLAAEGMILALLSLLFGRKKGY